jgi:hypothetical protein
MSETKEPENIMDESAIEGDSQHVLGKARSLIMESVEKQAWEFAPAIYPGRYDTSMDIVDIIPKLPEHVEVEMQSWILSDRRPPIEDTSEGYFLIPTRLNFSKYRRGWKGQHLRNSTEGFSKQSVTLLRLG